jgi:hypothetical protein
MMGFSGIIEPAFADPSQKRESRLSSYLNFTISTICLKCKCGTAVTNARSVSTVLLRPRGHTPRALVASDIPSTTV